MRTRARYARTARRRRIQHSSGAFRREEVSAAVRQGDRSALHTAHCETGWPGFKDAVGGTDAGVLALPPAGDTLLLLTDATVLVSTSS